MTTAIMNTLTEDEMMLVRDTERDQLAGLDEDGLLELHDRIRRARNKYVKLYRRQSGLRVTESGGRGKANPKGTRDRQKAEVFEDALARVSRAVAVAAKASAQQLKAERLQMAKDSRNTDPPRPSRPPAKARPGRQAVDRSPDSPGLRKRQASSRAAGARRQGGRDAR
ncbi:hypothetical protein [Catellatospora vulcania]|uniref:hypothetical protein n=1 Tax=Catellatospora vulcania TaxID=1460450 RepID=UPI0018AF8F2F|nr:hypothetical protein [Catellatospora vulcania]